MPDLVKIDQKCAACGEQGAFVLVAEIVVGDGVVQAAVPLCAQHNRARVRSVSMQTLPTHQPISMQPTDAFPPKCGEVFCSGTAFVVGCPRCAQDVSLKPEAFSVSDGKITPSFICPSCGLHAWLTIDSPHDA